MPAAQVLKRNPATAGFLFGGTRRHRLLLNRRFARVEQASANAFNRRIRRNALRLLTPYDYYWSRLSLVGWVRPSGRNPPFGMAGCGASRLTHPWHLTHRSVHRWHHHLRHQFHRTPCQCRISPVVSRTHLRFVHVDHHPIDDQPFAPARRLPAVLSPAQTRLQAHFSLECRAFLQAHTSLEETVTCPCAASRLHLCNAYRWRKKPL